jgi:surface carbohydrate biosynthesis protein
MYFYDRILIYTKFLYPKKFKWSIISADICIFDEGGSHHIMAALRGYDYTILRVRDTLYVKHLISIIPALFLFNKTNTLYFRYCCSLINHINPRLVITYVDNSRLIWKLDKWYVDKIKFLTIQNGNRYFIEHNNYPNYLSHFFYNNKKKKDIYHSNFLCLSNYDVDIYKKHGVKVNHFYPIGTLSSSKHNEHYVKRKKIYDLCLIANSTNDRPSNLTIMKYLLDYVDEYNVSACVALKRSAYSKGFKEYLSIFDKYYGNSTVVVVPNRDHEICSSMASARYSVKRPVLGSQYLSDASEITLGFASTVLRETFSRGNKIYPMNFEINEASSPFDLLNVNLKPSYKEFVEQLNYLLNVSQELYIDSNRKLMRYLNVFDVDSSPSKKLRFIIKRFLSSE